MADFEFDTTELDKWEKRLLKCIKDNPKQLKKTVRQAGNLMRKNVRRATPKGPTKKQPDSKIGTKKEHKPGDLRKSYRVKMARGNKYECEVGTNKFYAKMVEEGHDVVKYKRHKIKKRTGRGYKIKREKIVIGHAPGKFYFKKGFEQTEKEFPKLLKETVRKIAKEAGLDVWG